MPRVTCPACGVELDGSADVAGEAVECGDCRARLDDESWPRQQARSATTLATVSMVLGIGSLFMAVFNVVCCTGVVAGPMAVMAIVLGAMGMKPGSIKGFAVIGIVTGGLALLVLALTVAYVGVNLALAPAPAPRPPAPPQGF
jgi:hypothetical protein